MASSAITALSGAPQAPQSVATPQVGPAAKTHAPSTEVKPIDRPDKQVEHPQPEPVKPLRDPRSLAFQVDGSRIVTNIVDPQNNTVVEQIPDAEVIRLAAAIDRLQGFFLLAKA